MSTLHYTHYIKQKGKGCDNEVKNAFSTEEGANKLSINEAAQMCYLLLSKSLSLLQSMDEKRKNYNTFSFGALENSEYAMMVQNNMAVLLSDVFGRHGEALECLEDVVFWVLGEDDEGEQANDPDSDVIGINTASFHYTGESTSEGSENENNDYFPLRRVNDRDDDSYDSLAPIAWLDSMSTLSLSRERKAVLMLNSSRIFYRCGLFQDATEMYRQYTQLKFSNLLPIEHESNHFHSDDIQFINARHSAMWDILPCSRSVDGQTESFVSGCIAAAAA